MEKQFIADVYSYSSTDSRYISVKHSQTTVYASESDTQKRGTGIIDSREIIWSVGVNWQGYIRTDLVVHELIFKHACE